MGFLKVSVGVSLVLGKLLGRLLISDFLTGKKKKKDFRNDTALGFDASVWGGGGGVSVRFMCICMHMNAHIYAHVVYVYSCFPV